ncbi:MAG: hypothetical protein ACE361_12240 [Aureliella sp.]
MPNVAENLGGAQDPPQGWIAFANGLQIAVIAYLFDWLFLADVEIWFSVRLILLFVIILAAVTSRCWVIIVAAIGTSLLRGTPDRSLDLTLQSIAYVFSILMIAAYFYFFPSLRQAINTTIIGLFRPTAPPVPPTQQVESGSSSPPKIWFQLALTCLLIATFVALAACIIGSLPTERREKIEVYRVLLISDEMKANLSTIVVALLGAYLVLRELNFRRVAPFQARLFLRSHLMRDFGTELLSIHRRMRKREKKQLKQSSKIVRRSG